MPTPTDSQRLLGIMIGRHRKVAQSYYKEILDNLNQKQNAFQQIAIYRGLVNDLTFMLKELREQETHNRNLTYDALLEQLESMPGRNLKEKAENLIKNGR